MSHAFPPAPASVCGRAFREAWKRGYRAYLFERASSLKNPYRDKRTGYHNGPTFSIAWRRFWEEGRSAAEEELKEELQKCQVTKGVERG